MVIGLVVTGCFGGGKKAEGPPVSDSGPALTYVAIGASESVGAGADAPLREGWTKAFWTASMPRQTSFTDLAVSGSTTAQAVTEQLPLALELHPDYTTIWLNVNDIVAGISPADYEHSLSQIVSALSAGARTRVFVANTPPLDQLAAFTKARNGDFSNRSPFANRPVPTPSWLNTTVDAYNAAAARVAHNYGVTLVDLHAVGLAARMNGNADALIAGDGFHPSTQGHAAIAQAFAAALKITRP